MYNSSPMKILRKLLMFFGLLFVAAGAISSLVGEQTGFIAFSGLQNLLISSMGVVIFWLSLERVHPEGYKFFFDIYFTFFFIGLFLLSLGNSRFPFNDFRFMVF